MKTLVIHPTDSSTDFLKEVYKDLPFDIFPSNVRNLVNILQHYDRVICLGHGSPSGLFSGAGVGGFVVESMHKKALRKMKCVFIWCYASTYANLHGINATCTGMFISEVQEAAYLGYPNVTQEEVDYSNQLFARLLNEALKQDVDIYAYLKEHYKGEGIVISYNRNRLANVKGYENDDYPTRKFDDESE